VYRCLAPEKAQEGVTLFAQPTEPLLTATGIFTRDHLHVARQRFAVGESRRSAKNTSVANAVIGPTPGCVINSLAPGRCQAWSVIRSSRKTRTSMLPSQT